MTLRFARGRGAAAVGIGALALALAVGGIADATSGGRPKRISACVHRKGGGFYRAKHCKRHDRRLTWNIRGRRGATGPQGPTGPRGGPRGPRGAAGAQGPAGVSGAIVHYGPANQDVSSTNPANPTVLDAIALRPGSYVITANAWAQGASSATATIECGIDTGPGDHAVGESLTSHAQGSVEMTRPVSLGANAIYKLNCYRTNANDMRLVRTRLTAIKVGAVTTQ